MSVTKANWHTASLPEIEGDNPFEMPVEEVGQRIDLADPQGRLTTRLHELVNREGNLYNRGITCAIKDRPDTTCLACSACEAANPESWLGMLCKIGREQEAVLTELAVHATRSPA